MKSVDTLIVGAGPTGIGAAWACERDRGDWRLVEAASKGGGYAGTIAADGYRWDLGGHVIHSHFADFDTAVRASGVRMVPVRRTGRVLVGADTFVPTPIQQQLDRLPTDILPGADARHLAQYFRNEMGAELCASFFYPFNGKMWAHPLDEIDHTWTSHRSGSAQANVPLVGLRKPPGPAEAFRYPEFGSGSVWDGVVARLDPARQNYRVRLVALDADRHVAHFDDASEIRYGRLVSTLPLDQLCGMAGDARCKALVGTLVNTRVAVFGFGFRGPIPAILADKTYIYAAAAKVPWYRASVLSNYSAAMAPAGCWSILFECSSSNRTQAIDMDAAAAVCLGSLAALGVDLRTRDRSWSHFLPYGYPVPVLGRDAALRQIQSHFTALGVYARGRFGGWRYESCNQDHSFAQGVEAVTTGGDEVLWHPERFPATA